MGKTVFLKIYLLTLKKKLEFVDARQRYASEDNIQLTGGKVFGNYFLGALTNYDEKDSRICNRVNQDVLLWLAIIVCFTCTRLVISLLQHTWLSLLKRRTEVAQARYKAQA
jgi:hypothetical protein